MFASPLCNRFGSRPGRRVPRARETCSTAMSPAVGPSVTASQIAGSPYGAVLGPLSVPQNCCIAMT